MSLEQPAHPLTTMLIRMSSKLRGLEGYRSSPSQLSFSLLRKRILLPTAPPLLRSSATFFDYFKSSLKVGARVNSPDEFAAGLMVKRPVRLISLQCVTTRLYGKSHFWQKDQHGNRRHSKRTGRAALNLIPVVERTVKYGIHRCISVCGDPWFARLAQAPVGSIRETKVSGGFGLLFYIPPVRLSIPGTRPKEIPQLKVLTIAFPRDGRKLRRPFGPADLFL